jgi:hypothetical protein
MQSFLLPKADEKNIVKYVCSRTTGVDKVRDETRNVEYSFEMNILCDRLKETKAKLDIYYKDPKTANQFNRVLRMFDHFKDIKKRFEKEHNGQYVTNAWVKFWELVSFFDLIPREEYDNTKSFNVFCNACLPGSDVLAINHYIHSKTKIENFTWKASSLLDTRDKTIPLSDDYSLYKNYPHNWISDGVINNGDVLPIKNQLDIEEKIGESIDLFTSDLGFDVSDDYNNQETQHAHCNLGQIISGLITLRNGGSMVIKLYTFFTPFTMSLLTLVSSMFCETYISKPSSSKKANSEIYLVGKGFTHFNLDIKSYLLNRLENFSMDPLIESHCIENWKDFKSSFSNAARIIYNTQINYLNEALSIYKEFGTNTNKAKYSVIKFSDETKIIANWINQHPIRYLKNSQKLLLSGWGKKDNRLKLEPIKKLVSISQKGNQYIESICMTSTTTDEEPKHKFKETKKLLKIKRVIIREYEESSDGESSDGESSDGGSGEEGSGDGGSGEEGSGDGGSGEGESGEGESGEEGSGDGESGEGSGDGGSGDGESGDGGKNKKE